MPNDLFYPAPADGSGNPFVGAVTPADGHLRPLEGGTTTAITGSPSGASAVRLRTEMVDGGMPTIGTTTDAAWGGTGGGSLVALLKALYTELVHSNAAGANTALSTPPTTTNAGTDTVLTFSATVNHWTLQNNSNAVLYYNLDAAASTGTLVLQPGAQVWWDWPVTAVHAYTAAAINVNGATGLVLIGRL